MNDQNLKSNMSNDLFMIWSRLSDLEKKVEVIGSLDSIQKITREEIVVIKNKIDGLDSEIQKTKAVVNTNKMITDGIKIVASIVITSVITLLISFLFSMTGA